MLSLFLWYLKHLSKCNSRLCRPEKFMFSIALLCRILLNTKVPVFGVHMLVFTRADLFPLLSLSHTIHVPLSYIRPGFCFSALTYSSVLVMHPSLVTHDLLSEIKMSHFLHQKYRIDKLFVPLVNDSYRNLCDHPIKCSQKQYVPPGGILFSVKRETLSIFISSQCFCFSCS